jgi:4-diphosphocytidyl-2-C-methyl-D-erythritol kinase
MIDFPNSKINIGLRVLSRRQDSYHDLETLFYPVALRDALEVHPSSSFDLKVTGLAVKGDVNDNLCARAYHLLRQDHPTLPALKIWLHKQIPLGSGLGGGSADGAFALKLIRDQCGLCLSDQELLGYAARLGSDCPFFIRNAPCFATGRGETLEPADLDLSSYCLVLVHPAVSISTAWAFSRIAAGGQPGLLKEILAQPIQSWKNLLQNDFEGPVFESHPDLAIIKEKLYESGALYASMTGSGSTLYGIFAQQPENLSAMPGQVKVTIL